MSRGRPYIISGPSGSGKDTILKVLLAEHPEIRFSISSITRPMREGEKEGEKYHFISRDEFEFMLKEDMLLEHNEFVGNYYGTPRGPVDAAITAGEDIILEVDVNGAAQIREKLPEAISIFIMPPSFKVLKKRLSGRGTETEELVNKRMTSALSEIARAKEYDYIVVNDVIDDAVCDVASIIRGERLRTERQKEIINEVLKKC